MYVLQTSRFSRITAYIQHLKDLVANVGAYPLSSPFVPRAGPCSSPERREQQRILLPYKQSLMVRLPQPHQQTTLAIQEEMKTQRFARLGVQATRATHGDRCGVWEYCDAATSGERRVVVNRRPADARHVRGAVERLAARRVAGAVRGGDGVAAL